MSWSLPLVLQYVTILLFGLVPVLIFHGLFIASNPKIYLEKPDWYIKWLVTIDRPCAAWYGPENPLLSLSSQ
jgi:hypothetical protein